MYAKKQPGHSAKLCTRGGDGFVLKVAVLSDRMISPAGPSVAAGDARYHPVWWEDLDFSELISDVVGSEGRERRSCVLAGKIEVGSTQTSDRFTFSYFVFWATEVKRQRWYRKYRH